jgi:hypothetical protein
VVQKLVLRDAGIEELWLAIRNRSSRVAARLS